jgi:hypothetical protein
VPYPGQPPCVQPKKDQSSPRSHEADAQTLTGLLKLPRFRRVVLDLGDYDSVVTASIAAS